MLKKVFFEKIYLLMTIIMIGGYSTLNMLTTEHDSIYTAEDPILLKLFVGLLFMTSIGYMLTNISHCHIGKIGRILLFISLYMTVWRIIDIPLTASLLAYIYQPMRDILIVLLLSLGITISTKSKELSDFYSTGMIIAFLITALYYYKNWTFTNEAGEAHLGTAYYVLFLLPTILCSPKKIIRNLAILLTCIVIISSIKRGGVIALVLGLVAYLFVKEVLLEHKFTKLLYFLVLIIVLFITLIIIDNAMGNMISERMFNLVEDGGSGRNVVWKTTWDMICQSNTEQLLFGHGHNAVLLQSPLHLSAHNDFLEVLYDYGIVCFILYILLHIRLIQQIFTSLRIKDERAPIMAFTYVIFIILSMISHVIIYPWAALIAVSWGLMSTPKIERNIV